MHLPNCQTSNTLAEPQVTSVGTTTAACQALPTQAGAVNVNVEQGFCAQFWYSSDCTGRMLPACDEPTNYCARAYPPNTPNPLLFKSFNVVPA